MKAITRVISFTSGKGGVGKTNLVVNVGIALGRSGKSVLLLDADLGLANIDVLLGLRPRATIYEVLRGECPIEKIIQRGPEGISIIPAASGVEAITSLDSAERLLLMESIERVAYQFDYLLIDTRAGISPDVMYFNSASSEVMCVVTPEPTSLTDAYAAIKVLAQNYGERSVSVIVNNIPRHDVSFEQEARATFHRLAKAVDRFLHVQLKYIGAVPSDYALIDSVRSQRALLELYPSSPAGLAMASLARKIDEEFLDLRVKGGMQFFFRQLLEARS